jgi:hypothetical protein
MKRSKDPAMQALGSLGGKAKAASMTPKERTEYWSKVASAPRKKDVPRCNCPDGKHTMYRAITLQLACRNKAPAK